MSLLVSHSHHLDNDDIKLILASASPRRREILNMMGLDGKYEVTPSPLDESSLQQELKEKNSPQVYTRILAEKKAEALSHTLTTTGTTIVLGSDTIVDLKGSILEKPCNEEEANTMLHQLSNNQHQVHTGVAIYLVQAGGDDGKPVVSLHSSFTDTATVQFAQLSDEDIAAYIATGEPMDKAGSYGIQGVGGQFVSSLMGDFFTVMGLPMHRTSVALTDAIQNASK